MTVRCTCSIEPAFMMWRRIKLPCGEMPFPAHLDGARFDHIKGVPDVALADDLTAFSEELLA